MPGEGRPASLNSSIIRAYTYAELDSRRRAALAEVDNASFSWFHVKVCLVAGVGFFTDAYDIFAINVASTMLGYVYNNGNPLSKHQDLGVKVSTLVGTLIGQLGFGLLADIVGRKRMYGIELAIIIVATLAQALAGGGEAINVIQVIIFWRFLMGIGIGGDYPLSAVISSEFASTRIRGRMMTAVFANQGWGQLASALVALIVVIAYKQPLLREHSDSISHIDYMWRLLIGLGCIPGVVALYFRLTIPETPRYTMDIEMNVQQACVDIHQVVCEHRHGSSTATPWGMRDGGQAGCASCDELGIGGPIVWYRRRGPGLVPSASWKDFWAYFSQRKNAKVLFGTAYSWFALDVAFYGLGLNNGIILSSIGFGGATPPGSTTSTPETSHIAAYKNLKDLCLGNLILTIAGFIPGYWVAFAFIDVWGRKNIQMMGFIVLTVLFIIMGFTYEPLIKTTSGKIGFVFFYCLANFFQNFGPNTTTFIVPGEAFPTRYRSTAHGISAASGKLGSIVSQVVFFWMKDIGGPNKFVGHIIEILALFMLTGVFSTMLIPETKQKSLELLSSDKQDEWALQDENVSADTINLENLYRSSGEVGETP